jgi:hypothetical protein
LAWAIPLCRWPFPRLCGIPRTGDPFTFQRADDPLFGFHLPLEFRTTIPSRPVATGRRLSWIFIPYSTFRHRRSLPRRAYQTRRHPPSGFDYPLGGLIPSMPGRFCFAPAALMGFALRSLSTRAACPAFPPSIDPHTVLPASNSRRISGGPARQTTVSGASSARAFHANSACLARRPQVAPLGFFPFRVLQRKPQPRFRPVSSQAPSQIGTRPSTWRHGGFICLRPAISASTQAPPRTMQPS